MFRSMMIKNPILAMWIALDLYVLGALQAAGADTGPGSVNDMVSLGQHAKQQAAGWATAVTYGGYAAGVTFLVYGVIDWRAKSKQNHPTTFAFISMGAGIALLALGTVIGFAMGVLGASGKTLSDLGVG